MEHFGHHVQSEISRRRLHVTYEEKHLAYGTTICMPLLEYNSRLE